MSRHKFTPEDFDIAGKLAVRIGSAIVDELGEGSMINASVIHAALGSVLEHTFRGMSTDAERSSLLDAFIDALSVRVNALMAPIDDDADADDDDDTDVHDVPEATGVQIVDCKNPSCGPHLVLMADDDTPIAHAVLPLQHVPAVIEALRTVLFNKAMEDDNAPKTLQ